MKGLCPHCNDRFSPPPYPPPSTTQSRTHRISSPPHDYTPLPRAAGFHRLNNSWQWTGTIFSISHDCSALRAWRLSAFARVCTPDARETICHRSRLVFSTHATVGGNVAACMFALEFICACGCVCPRHHHPALLLTHYHHRHHYSVVLRVTTTTYISQMSADHLHILQPEINIGLLLKLTLMNESTS